jgi:hypothetical protein
MKIKLLLLLIILLLSPTGTSAHPGNTDANGGHYCWTNCEDWGLNYGEYHYHDDYNISNDQSDYDDGYQKGYDTAYGYTSQCIEDYSWSWEGPQAYGDGFEDGIKVGHKDGLAICEKDKTNLQELQDSMDSLIDSNNKSNDTHFDWGNKQNSKEVSSNKLDSVEKETDFPVTNEVIFFISALISIPIIYWSYHIYKRRKHGAEK